MSRTLVVVPTYNEADNVGPLLDGIAAHAPGIHVLFVDDASQDGTRAVLAERMAREPDRLFLLPRAGKLGLGTAYVDGFRWALAHGYGAVVEMDADLSHRPVDLAAILKALENAAVVVGSRYVAGGGTLNWNRWRKLISQCGSTYARLALGIPVRDFTGGFNAWRREVIETIGLEGVRSEGYSFQIELKYRAALAGYPIVEVPIQFEERRAGQSKMSGSIVAEAIVRVWFLAARRKAVLAEIAAARGESQRALLRTRRPLSG